MTKEKHVFIGYPEHGEPRLLSPNAYVCTAEEAIGLAEMIAQQHPGVAVAGCIMVIAASCDDDGEVRSAIVPSVKAARK